MINVGVFPSGSEVSIEIARALDTIRDISLVGLSSARDYGAIAFKTNYVDVPYYNNPLFVSEIATYVKRHDLDFLIPGMDEVGFLLKGSEKEIGCEVVYPALDTAEIIRRKSETYAALADYVLTPKVYNVTKDLYDIEFPIFCKPDIGYGSRGARPINTSDELKQLSQEEFEKYIFMEILPGEELTVDCISNLKSELLFVGARRRTRVRVGISVSTEPVDLTEEIRKFADKISKQLGMTGCWFFQIKKDKHGSYRLLEVAGRVSGSMAMYRLLGINFILLDLYQRMGIPIKIPNLLKGNFRLERAFDVNLVGKLEFDSVYIDLDDCLILRGGVNTRLISFVYACRNVSIPVFLITRHTGDLSLTLEKFGLSHLFSDTFHLKNGEPKSNSITHSRPLFIDDSFSERDEVSRALNCSVAAPSMIHEGLLG